MNIKTNKGFSLLEILLSIVLISILIIILIGGLNPNGILSEVRDNKREADALTIYQALEQYALKNNSYPPAVVSLYNGGTAYICKTGAPSCNGVSQINLSSILVPAYLAKIPEYSTDTNNSGFYIVKDANGKIGIGGVKQIDNTTFIKGVANQSFTTNPPQTPEELIQAQITAGTLVPTGTQQLVLGRLVYKNNAGTQTYIDPATTTKTCPAGYIPVPGNSMYGTTDFCVMKYEAKTGSSTVAATTQAAGTPQGNISQTNAVTSCNLNGAGYGLINNAEWMTIARNIEAQPVNWTGGFVGSGGLWRGHTDNSPATALAANTNDNLGYEGTGNTSPSIERRTHVLSNGEIVWDLGGNMREWLFDTILGQDKPNNNSGDFYQEWTSISNFGTLNYDLTKPSNNTWNSTQNLGQYYAGTVTGTNSVVFQRGGVWSFTTDSGVFTLILNTSSNTTFPGVGFRCVFR